MSLPTTNRAFLDPAYQARRRADVRRNLAAAIKIGQAGLVGDIPLEDAVVETHRLIGLAAIEVLRAALD